MRRALFWMHLGSGVVASALILFFSMTGALLAYERAILHAADARSYIAEAASASSNPMPLDALLASVTNAVPGPLDTVTLHPAPSAPIEIVTARHDTYLVDIYSAKVQGPMSPRWRAFFAEVTALHRWFGLSNANHATATLVKGATTLLFLFLIASGTILWLPRRWWLRQSWTRSTLRTGLLPGFDAAQRTRHYNWHKVAGFWTGLPLVVIVLTGVVMAYPWANALLFKIAGSTAPARGQARQKQQLKSRALPTHLDQVFAHALDGEKGWRSASLRLVPDAHLLQVTVDDGDGGQPQKREQVSIDATSLQMVRRQPFKALSQGQRWRSWVRFVHTGEAGGLWGETLALLATLGAVILSWTGISLSLGRLQRWRAAARRSANYRSGSRSRE